LDQELRNGNKTTDNLSFNLKEDTIEKAQKYVKARNEDKTRELCLGSGSF
jgi:ssRNA-specific RNase YbeY (16S rRNA maturation enzyme)